MSGEIILTQQFVGLRAGIKPHVCNVQERMMLVVNVAFLPLVAVARMGAVV